MFFSDVSVILYEKKSFEVFSQFIRGDIRVVFFIYLKKGMTEGSICVGRGQINITLIWFFKCGFIIIAIWVLFC